MLFYLDFLSDFSIFFGIFLFCLETYLKNFGYNLRLVFVKPRLTFSKFFSQSTTQFVAVIVYLGPNWLSDPEKALARRTGISFLRREKPKWQKAVKAMCFPHVVAMKFA